MAAAPAVTRTLFLLPVLAWLAACSLNTVAPERPPELQPGAGCHQLAGNYANKPETPSGFLLSQIFFDLEPARHLAINEVQLIEREGAQALIVSAGAGGQPVDATEIRLRCKDGRWSFTGQSHWQSEGLGLVAAIRHGQRVWLARDGTGGLIAEVRKSHTGLLLGSIAIATRFTEPVLRYAPAAASPADPRAVPVEPDSIARICAGDRPTFCASGLSVDDLGGFSSVNLWTLLSDTPPPEGLDRVAFEADDGGAIWLLGLAGHQPVERTSLAHLGFRCVAGELSRAADAEMVAASDVGLIGVGRRRVQFGRAGDGALMVRDETSYAGMVMLLMPIYFDWKDWYRFEPAPMEPSSGHCRQAVPAPGHDDGAAPAPMASDTTGPAAGQPE